MSSDAVVKKKKERENLNGGSETATKKTRIDQVQQDQK